MSSMGDQDHFSVSATAERPVSTPPAVSGTAGGLPPRTGGRRNRSEAWNHFSMEPDVDKKARCNYCSVLIKYDNGTSAMRSHSKRCKDNPNRESNKRQKSGPSSAGTAEGLVTSPSYAKFDQDICRNELVRMFVAAELPFRFVENEDFRKFLNVLQPRFSIPSRTTLARDVLTLWDMERTKLKRFLSKQCRRVCLTTDTWTSCQNLTYMSLTAHFIDNEWNLHKKILNFCQVTSHSGKVMAKAVESCLNGWELNRIFSLTVDNASSNDVGIQYLKKRLATWNTLVLKGEWIHMRCCAHILNLIVKDGLKEIDDSILRIRGAVKYIKSSPSRMAKFKACVEQGKIDYKGLVPLDVETRWNSTYLMLDAALKHQKAFEELEMQDKKFTDELEKGKGVPVFSDWDYASSILPFLKIFYDATVRISGTSYVTSNIYMLEVLGIGKKINKICDSNDVDLSVQMMAMRMKAKYNKYWGKTDDLNLLLLIAVVFDPKCKLDYVNWLIDELFDFGEADNLKKKLESCLNLLFKEYGGCEEGTESDQPEDARLEHEDDDDPYCWNQYLKSTGRKSNVKSELKKYLDEEPDATGFGILDWWKQNSSRFPVLGKIARELLAVPVSTVASESAFSTGGRVLDPYRSSLSPKTVEALICTQDWLKGTPFSLLSPEEFDDLLAEMSSQQDMACLGTVTLEED